MTTAKQEIKTSEESGRARTDLKLAVIIVGYNHREFLPDCMSSLVIAISYLSAEIIFVDNNSSDGTEEFVKTKYPQVVFIQTGANLGFAGGNNVGFDRARELGCRYVFLLNPDTVIDADCIRRLAVRADEKTILQPLLLLHQGGYKTDKVNTAGNALHYLGYSYVGDVDKVRADFTEEREITLASGAGLWLPLALIDKIGGFDERFLAYHEDADLCWRARIADYEIKLLPSAVVWHKYNFGRSKSKWFLIERNRLLFIAKNYQLHTIIFLFPMLVLNEIPALALSVKDGFITEKIKSYWSALCLAQTTASERGRVARTRKRRDRELKRFFVARFYFEELRLPLLDIYNTMLIVYWGVVARFL